MPPEKILVWFIKPQDPTAVLLVVFLLTQ